LRQEASAGLTATAPLERRAAPHLRPTETLWFIRAYRRLSAAKIVFLPVSEAEYRELAMQ
jgi:hypothetical protein